MTIYDFTIAYRRTIAESREDRVERVSFEQRLKFYGNRAKSVVNEKNVFFCITFCIAMPKERAERDFL